MTVALTTTQIATAFIDACRLEVRALKPGNVHIYAPGHGMQVADFEKSAEVAAPHISNRDLRVGDRIRRAVDATFDAVHCNTNLGILLLCVPLAAAVELPPHQSLEARLKTTLAALNHDDTRDVFQAIARATPGGLGEAEHGDVRAAPPPGMTLMSAMEQAATRDLIAREYVNGFNNIFALENDRYGPRLAAGWSAEDALARVYLSELARSADTHIARKFGRPKAEQVRAKAARVKKYYFASADDRPSAPIQKQALIELDAELKAEGLNPGSLADLMVAVAFTHNLKAAALQLG